MITCFLRIFPPIIVRGGDSRELLQRLSNVTPLSDRSVSRPSIPISIYSLDAAQGNKALSARCGPIIRRWRSFSLPSGPLARGGQRAVQRECVRNGRLFRHLERRGARISATMRRRYDLDLSSDLMNWSRRGVFMYSIVHPKSYVLADIARRLFVKTGLAIRNDEFRRLRHRRSCPRRDFPGLSGDRGIVRRSRRLSVQARQFPYLQRRRGVFDAAAIFAGCYEVYKRARPSQIVPSARRRLAAGRGVLASARRLARENLAAGATPVL